MPNSGFLRVFDPIQIGNFTAKNRFVMPAMATCFASKDHCVTDTMIAYYSKRAEGGTGLIIVEATCVDDPIGVALPHQLCIDSIRYVAGFRRLVDAVHSHGAKIAIQLHHAGPKSHLAESPQPVGPSPTPIHSGSYSNARQLDSNEIDQIVQKFALASRFAREAGFDAVELLCAHGYLLNHFLSPHTNKRRDGYGGSLKNRMRIIQEIFESIREVAGDDFPILCKAPGDDYVDGGITISDGISISENLEAIGAAAITVTGGGYADAHFFHIAPMSYPEGWQVHLAERIKERVKIPVVAIGKIKHPQLVEEIVKDGRADMVALGRALIAEPYFVKKLTQNRVDDILPCISCNFCRKQIGNNGNPLRCAVNGFSGREKETRFVPPLRRKNILIAGGGPAGMQAALVLSDRGHSVTLCEKSAELGGQLSLAAKPSDKIEINAFVDYLANQLKKNKVRVNLGRVVNNVFIEKLSPDAVICATGAKPADAGIKGANLKSVVSAWDALLNPQNLGERVIVCGGGMVGCETATFLAETGRSVIIIEQCNDICIEYESFTRVERLSKLRNFGVTILTGLKIEEISEEGVVFLKNGRVSVVPAESVILALGSKPNTDLMVSLANSKLDVFAIGDCIAPRGIAQSTFTALHIASWL